MDGNSQLFLESHKVPWLFSNGLEDLTIDKSYHKTHRFNLVNSSHLGKSEVVTTATKSPCEHQDFHGIFG